MENRGQLDRDRAMRVSPRHVSERRWQRRAVAINKERPQPVSELWRTVFDNVGERCPRHVRQEAERVCEVGATGSGGE